MLSTTFSDFSKTTRVRLPTTWRIALCSRNSTELVLQQSHTSETYAFLITRTSGNLFYLPAQPQWLIPQRAAAAVARVTTVAHTVAGWGLQDTLAARLAEIGLLLSGTVFNGSPQVAAHVAAWTAFAAGLPQGMTLEEVLSFLSAEDDVDQRQVLDAVAQRLGEAPVAGQAQQRRIRILTMHGAKGLSGKVVFIPSAEQGVIPSFSRLLTKWVQRRFHIRIAAALP